MKDKDDPDFIKLKTYNPPVSSNYSESRFARDCNITLLLVVGTPILFVWVLFKIVQAIF